MLRFLFIAGVCAFSLFELQAQPSRILGPVDRTRNVTVTGNVSRLATACYETGLADPALKINYITIQFRPSADQQAALEQLLAEQQHPGSPEYHHWLTPEQYAARFGVSPNDAAAVAGWLRSEGFTVHDISRGRSWITFSGTAAQVNRALHTEMHTYNIEGKMHFANATEPSVPSALAGVIAAFRGLNDFEPQYREISSIKPEFDFPSGTHALTPGDFATIYDINPLYAAGIDGSGQNLAILGLSDIDVTKIEQFRSHLRLAVQRSAYQAVRPRSRNHGV